MRFDPVKVALFDGIVSSYLEKHADIPERWVLEQDIYTATARRALLGVLSIEEGWAVLDAGCGFGVVPLELAGNLRLDCHGLDLDPAKLEVARELQGILAEQEHPFPGSSVRFQSGSLSEIPYEDESFDFVMASFVFQHLAEPEVASDELYRVIKPGGLACLVDADDGLSLVYPESSEAFSRLSEAFDRNQELDGGDRKVGRKLASFLDGSGFEIAASLILPAAEYRASTPDEPGRRFVIERFTEARESIISRNLMSQSDFDSCLSEFKSESSLVQYRANAQVVTVGRRPS